MSAADGNALKYVRLFADEDGETHFEDVELPLTERAPGLGVLDMVTEAFPVKSAQLRRVTENDEHGDSHCAPRRQLLMNLTGAVEIEVTDGSKRVLGPHELTLAEDVEGKGHITRGVGELPRLQLVLVLAD